MFFTMMIRRHNSEEQPKTPLLRPSAAAESFHIIAITFLSLLLPLSFLLLSRFSCAHYLFSLAGGVPFSGKSLLLKIFFNIIPPVLYILVSTVTIAALIHGLTGKITFSGESPANSYRPRLFASWTILCVLQLCIGLGIEGSMKSGISGAAANFATQRSLISKVAFFLGLHEIMLLWFRVIVRPVVNDAVLGFPREERWIERAAVAASLGSLWWWKLRDEVETLVFGAEGKIGISIGITAVDLFGWWLYYVTVTVGMVRVVKGVMWVGMVLVFERVRVGNSDQIGAEEEDGDKV